MALVFNGFELGRRPLGGLIADHVTNEGESTWFEGFQLLAVYVVLGLAFFFASEAALGPGLSPPRRRSR